MSFKADDFEPGSVLALMGLGDFFLGGDLEPGYDSILTEPSVSITVTSAIVLTFLGDYLLGTS